KPGLQGGGKIILQAPLSYELVIIPNFGGGRRCWSVFYFFLSLGLLMLNPG
ncbi:hypothetical protein Nmel_011405, partial [Mimus melanotis]